MKKRFFKTAVKNIKTTGAISQSSRFLVNKMLKDVDFTSARNIVELGPGNGNVTKAILERMHVDCQLFSFEINDVFYNEVNKINDKRLTVLHECAEKLHNHLKQGSVDAVVSSLPLAMFDKVLKKGIFDSIQKVIKKEGLFVQYQYSLSDYKLIRKEFEQVDLKMTILNIPPAFIYIGQNRPA